MNIKQFKNVDVYVDEINMLYLSAKSISELFNLSYKRTAAILLEKKFSKTRITLQTKPINLYQFIDLKDWLASYNLTLVNELQEWVNNLHYKSIPSIYLNSLFANLETIEFIDENTGIRIETTIDKNIKTLWVTQDQLAKIFQVSKQTFHGI